MNYQEKKQKRYSKKLCVLCGEPNDRHPLTYCSTCAEKTRIYMKNLRMRRHGDEKCIICGRINDRYPKVSCSNCNEKRKNWRKNNRGAWLERRARWKRELKEEIIKLFNGKCEICGYNKSPAALDFHHKNFDGKESSKNWKLHIEIRDQKISRDNIQLLCANCHRELHAQAFRMR